METLSKRTRIALKAIEDAVFFLLAEKEFEYITAQDIYRRAGVNKMTFYKYHKNKYDALAKAFTSRLNEEYDLEEAKWQKTQESMSVDDANYLALLFVANFFGRYRVQFAHLVSNSGDFPKEVVFSAFFANYRRYFSYVIGRELTQENEYLVHFVFGAFRAIFDCQMQKFAQNPDDEFPTQDVKKACRIISRSFSSLLRSLQEEGDSRKRDAAA